MAKRIIGHQVTRPGRTSDDLDITFPVAKDMATVPGIPRRDDEVTFYSREYPTGKHRRGRERVLQMG